MSEKLTNKERRVYRKQIARLQADNQLLAHVIADERHLRQQAWSEYWHRCHSRIWRFFDIMLLLSSESKARREFYADATNRLPRSA